MSTARLDAAAIVQLATVKNVADPTHEAGLVFRVAHSTSSGQATAADIPKNARGRYWDVLSVGANVQWGFLLIGDTAPTLVYGQLSATGTGHLAAAPTLLDSQPKAVYCPMNAVRVVFVSSAAPAAPAAFEAVVSGGKTTSQMGFGR